MKAFSVRMSFTDRKQGPGTGRRIEVKAGSLPGALAKASREFWKNLNTKQRNDARRDGLRADALEISLDTGTES